MNLKHMKSGLKRGPKYTLSEIAEEIGVDVLKLLRLSRKYGGLPNPLHCGNYAYTTKGGKDVYRKSYYSKKEVLDWYSKLISQEASA